MRGGSLFSICFLVAFIWNCPKRQTATRIVYEPPPPPAPQAAAEESGGALVIAEPQPPEPEEVGPTEPVPAERAPAKRRPRLARPEPTLEPIPEPEAAAPVEVPALEPRASPDRQAAQRQQIADLQERVHARIIQAERARLSDEERRTLEDARTFLSQSERALHNNDLQRASTLARKASMLLAVLEQE